MSKKDLEEFLTLLENNKNYKENVNFFYKNYQNKLISLAEKEGFNFTADDINNYKAPLKKGTMEYISLGKTALRNLGVSALAGATVLGSAIGVSHYPKNKNKTFLQKLSLPEISETEEAALLRKIDRSTVLSREEQRNIIHYFFRKNNFSRETCNNLIKFYNVNFGQNPEIGLENNKISGTIPLIKFGNLQKTRSNAIYLLSRITIFLDIERLKELKLSKKLDGLSKEEFGNLINSNVDFESEDEIEKIIDKIWNSDPESSEKKKNIVEVLENKLILQKSNESRLSSYQYTQKLPQVNTKFEEFIGIRNSLDKEIKNITKQYEDLLEPIYRFFDKGTKYIEYRISKTKSTTLKKNSLRNLYRKFNEFKNFRTELEFKKNADDSYFPEFKREVERFDDTIGSLISSFDDFKKNIKRYGILFNFLIQGNRGKEIEEIEEIERKQNRSLEKIRNLVVFLESERMGSAEPEREKITESQKHIEKLILLIKSPSIYRIETYDELTFKKTIIDSIFRILIKIEKSEPEYEEAQVAYFKIVMKFITKKIKDYSNENPNASFADSLKVKAEHLSIAASILEEELPDNPPELETQGTVKTRKTVILERKEKNRENKELKKSLLETFKKEIDKKKESGDRKSFYLTGEKSELLKIARETEHISININITIPKEAENLLNKQNDKFWNKTREILKQREGSNIGIDMQTEELQLVRHPRDTIYSKAKGLGSSDFQRPSLKRSRTYMTLLERQKKSETLSMNKKELLENINNEMIKKKSGDGKFFYSRDERSELLAITKEIERISVKPDTRLLEIAEKSIANQKNKFKRKLNEILERRGNTNS